MTSVTLKNTAKHYDDVPVLRNVKRGSRASRPCCCAGKHYRTRTGIIGHECAAVSRHRPDRDGARHVSHVNSGGQPMHRRPAPPRLIFQ
ncbi:hypothetical protein SAMN04487769_0482 [Burkholderia sp. b14]|nr:hypothetical protein SAMN04487769_0482 [Burkholderia sp. b14]SIT78701.1 hypothetical protein SAMN04487768_0078 [Burkholderia sp. b13]